MTERSSALLGAKFFEVDGEPCFAIGWRKLDQQAICEIAESGRFAKILFYSITFSSVDLSVLTTTSVHLISFMGGSVSTKELDQVCSIPTLRRIQLVGTYVTNEQLDEIKRRFPRIVFE